MTGNLAASGPTASPAVLVAVPCLDWVWTDAMLAFMGLRTPPGSVFSFNRHASSLAAKRTSLAEQFLADPRFGALCFCDADMTPPPDALERLLAHDLPIVGALCFSRVPPHVAAAGHALPDGGYTTLATRGGADPLRRVDLIGTGFLLIRRAALEAIPRPWFSHPASSRPGEGEDHFFCRRAAEAGLSLHCDTSVVAGHLGATAIGLEYVEAWARTPQAAEMLPDPVGPGELPHRRRGPVASPAAAPALTSQLEELVRRGLAAAAGKAP